MANIKFDKTNATHNFFGARNMGICTMVSSAADGSNSPAREEFLKAVEKLAEKYGTGADSLPNLARVVTQAASEGKFSTNKDPDGNDDAEVVYSRWQEVSARSSSHKVQSAGSRKAQVSKLRSFIKAGIASNKSGVSMLDILDKARDLRIAMEAAEEKVYPAYEAYVNIARAFVKTSEVPDADLNMSDDAIKAAMRKPESGERTVEDRIKSIQSAINAVSDDVPENVKDELVKAAHRITAALKKLNGPAATSEDDKAE